MQKTTETTNEKLLKALKITFSWHRVSPTPEELEEVRQVILEANHEQS
jgi:hypothetical protein